MKRILIPLGTIGSSGILATGSWLIYDKQINPILSKRYGNQWQPIDIKLNKFDNTPSSDPYSGSSCFQRFFGVTIEKFSSIATSTTDSSNSKKFEPLFENTTSDIYGCAVGQEKDFYEVVLKNDKVGFAIWFNNQHKQKIFLLKKENSSGNWQVEIGIPVETQTSSFLTSTNQIKNKVGSEKWSWWFMMDQATTTTSGNMQKWVQIFNPGSTKTFYENHEWKTYSNSSFMSGQGKIPDFNKVTTLDNYCNEQGAMRKEKQTEDKKLEVFCLLSK